MKTLKPFLLIVVFLLISCSSTEKYKAMEEFLISDVINPKYKYLLIDDKIKTINTLRILYGHDSINEKYNEIIPLNNQRSEMINGDDWKLIYARNINDTLAQKWKLKNLTTVDVELQVMKGLYNTKFLNNYANNEKRIIWLSNPIYYKEKKIMIFYFSESNTFKNVTKVPKVIIMKRNKSKWEVVDEVEYYRFY